MALKRIAIVGAGGNVGSATLRNLLQINPDVAITIVTREDSSSEFPESSQITIKKGSYDDANFLHSDFKDAELAMFALSFSASGAPQRKMIEAAAKAGVRWIIPNEYAGDGTNKKMFESVEWFHDKIAAREHIVELSKKYEGLSYIGVATNPWTEGSINWGLFGFNVGSRKATMYDGAGSFNSSSMNQVGLGIARLLSLPVTSSSDPRASLSHYANKFVYISSFFVTQDKLFDSIKKATATSDSDWTISKSSIENAIKSGDGGAAVYAHYMGEGLGGDYEAKAKEDRPVLGLKEENLDEIVKAAVAQ